MVKEIPLSNGRVALVDDEDYEKIKNLTLWSQKMSNKWYVCYQVGYDKQNRLHRLLLNAKKGDICDHINGNGLDNRRINLRLVNKSQNNANSNKWKKITSSKYKGVSWFKRDKKWQAKIEINYKQIHLGLFTDEVEAAKAYDKAARKYFGEYAKLNFNENTHRCFPSEETIYARADAYLRRKEGSFI